MPVRDVPIVGAGPSDVSRYCREEARPRLPGRRTRRASNSIFNFPPQRCFSLRPSCSKSGAAVRRMIADARRGACITARSSRHSICRSFVETVVDRAKRHTRPRGGGSGVRGRDAVGRGVRRIRHARQVLAIGYDKPNFLNVPGEELPHVHHYYAEPHAYHRQRGNRRGNSAANGAGAVQAGAHDACAPPAGAEEVDQSWVRPDIENRIKEGRLPDGSARC